jgi:glycosyltransferase involved in cell wall biosynthesis
MLLSNPFRPDPRVLKEARSLARAGYKVTVICWDRAAEMRPQEKLEFGVRIIRVQNVPSSYGVGALQLLRLPVFWLATFPILNCLLPDIIHCHDFDTLPAGLFWGLLHARPVVYDAHEYYPDLCKPRLRGMGGKLLFWLILIFERIGAHMASGVVTVDETLGTVYRRANRRVVVIGHYPPKVFASKGTPVFTRSDLTLLYIGRLSVDRGLLIYADILRSLRALGIPARLRLAGTFTSAQEEQKLHERCRGLEDALDIIGWVHYDAIPSVLRCADLGLAILQPEPRYKVALPIKLFEYMAVGLPIIASDFPPIASMIKNVQCGVVVNPLDLKTAVERIVYWWEHPNKVRTLGANGRRAVLEKYNWETLAERLDDLYVSLGGKTYRRGRSDPTRNNGHMRC